MNKQLNTKLKNLIFVLGHTDQKESEEIVQEAAKYIKQLESELKDEQEKVTLLESAAIRKSVRGYNEHT